jgi:hypothetical protein
VEDFFNLILKSFFSSSNSARACLFISSITSRISFISMGNWGEEHNLREILGIFKDFFRWFLIWKEGGFDVLFY